MKMHELTDRNMADPTYRRKDLNRDIKQMEREKEKQTKFTFCFLVLLISPMGMSETEFEKWFKFFFFFEKMILFSFFLDFQD
jgi:hypothetical protein